ncbi:MAG: serine/threonine-protein phosphatase [Bacteroidaceae bacterium]|nr:serine/threonine-protein phosphatase [Bacteroidaceae bacterium]
MTYYGKTDIGRLRQHNEDTFIAQSIWNDTHLLCAAIDGIGGNWGGDVAAEITHKTMISHLEDFPVWNLSECLQRAVTETNNNVIYYQRAIPKYREMGCVMSGGVINIKDRCLHFVHIGDTRIYTLQDGQLDLLTRDEAQGRLVKNYIGKRPIMPETPFCKAQKKRLKADTTLLFCSDGLWKMLDEKEIIEILSLRLSSKSICNRLISRANEKGGTDNITAVVVKL